MDIELIMNHRATAEKNIVEIASHWGVKLSSDEKEEFMSFYDYHGLAETINNVVAWSKKKTLNDNTPTGLALYSY